MAPKFRAAAVQRCLALIWAGALALALVIQQPAAAGPDEGCLTSRINSERQSRAESSLISNSSLISIARGHSEQMAKDQRYYHNANLRSELPSGWRTEGENVGWATDCAQMHSFFMNSPTHRENILNSAFNQIGVGVVVDSAGKLWVTEVFMQTEGSSGLSDEKKAALEAPEKPVDKNAPQPAGIKAEPQVSSKPPSQKPPPSAVPATTRKLQPKSSPIRRAAPPATDAPEFDGPQNAPYELDLEGRPEWDYFAGGPSLMIFNLDPPV